MNALSSNPMRNLTSVFLMVVLSASLASAQQYIIEPDDYPDGTALNNIHPKVELAIHSDLESFPEDFGEFPAPNIIPVTALENEDIFGGYFTSTGTHSFGNAGVVFNSPSRAIGMRFLGAATTVRIDAIGSSNTNATVGVLDVFDINGTFLETVETATLNRQAVGTLSIRRDQGDIGYARAYSSDDFSPFGRFDNLQFSMGPLLPGDVNRDGDLNFSDIPSFIDVLTRGTFEFEADCDDSGAVDFADIPAFIGFLIGQ